MKILAFIAILASLAAAFGAVVLPRTASTELPQTTAERVVVASTSCPWRHGSTTVQVYVS